MCYEINIAKAYGNKSVMTRFAREIQPGINLNYEDFSKQCFVVKTIFEKKEDAIEFLNRFWKGIEHESYIQFKKNRRKM